MIKLFRSGPVSYTKKAPLKCEAYRQTYYSIAMSFELRTPRRDMSWSIMPSGAIVMFVISNYVGVAMYGQALGYGQYVCAKLGKLVQHLAQYALLM